MGVVKIFFRWGLGCILHRFPIIIVNLGWGSISQCLVRSATVVELDPCPHPIPQHSSDATHLQTPSAIPQRQLHASTAVVRMPFVHLAQCRFQCGVHVILLRSPDSIVRCAGQIQQRHCCVIGRRKVESIIACRSDRARATAFPVGNPVPSSVRRSCDAASPNPPTNPSAFGHHDFRNRRNCRILRHHF